MHDGLDFGDGFIFREDDGDVEREAGEFRERFKLGKGLAEFGEGGEIDFKYTNGVFEVEVVGDGGVEFVNGADFFAFDVEVGGFSGMDVFGWFGHRFKFPGGGAKFF